MNKNKKKPKNNSIPPSSSIFNWIYYRPHVSLFIMSLFVYYRLSVKEEISVAWIYNTKRERRYWLLVDCCCMLPVQQHWICMRWWDAVQSAHTLCYLYTMSVDSSQVLAMMSYIYKYNRCHLFPLLQYLGLFLIISIINTPIKKVLTLFGIIIWCS